MTQKFMWRHISIVLFSVGLLIYLFMGPIITQDPLYHLFADSRVIFGIPNFFDVLSNLPFALLGGAGAMFLIQTNKIIENKNSWLTFFVGVILVAPGSAYYHWAPDNARLVWDRLPMTIGFMGLFVALISEYIDRRLERTLPIFIILGFASVIVWHVTSDLRLYYWVQMAPLFSIPLIMIIYPSRYTGRQWLLLAFMSYILAKIVEFRDPQIFALTSHTLSGHTLKHLAASLAPLFIMKMLQNRVPKPLN